MNLLLNLKIAHKLALSFAAVIAVLLALTAIVLNSLSAMEKAQSWNTHTYRVLEVAGKLVSDMVDRETGLRGYLIAGDEKFLEPMKAGEANFAQNFKAIKALTSDNPVQQDRLDKVKALEEQWATQVGKVEIELMRNPATREQARSMEAGGAGKTSMDGIRSIMAQVDKMERDLLAVRQAASDSAGRFATWAMVGGSVITIVFAIFFGFFLTKTVATPIVSVVAQLKKVSEGDFNVTMTGLGRKDEVGQIAGAGEMIVERFGDTIATIKVSSSEVTNAAVEIANATTDLSQRTEEQAASLEETSSSMEEMSATVKKNAENAKQASDLAVSARDVANRGGAVVTKTVEAMAQIEDSSTKISNIIVVIDEIARQTNLLALNAAVEAARAGEAGRGFAVVASEVRSLAQRSSQAAKDIKDLINSSSTQVKDGVELVNKVGQSLDEIVTSIQKVTAVVSEIASASIEQSTGITEITKALSQMDVVTQQNSALVEENAATAKTLEQQAKAMSNDQRIAFFRPRVKGHSATAQVGQHAPAPRVEPSATPASKTVPQRTPAGTKAAPARRTAGTARGMQTALATAVNDEWQQF
ncbi:methyl-accepting chemotaxis protein [Undibacter mobilis]|uniref:HAMP domain-containing protein n=1 Tax=Undibacter mobilis TaxID=2292256 RepID=A0A371BCP9_9BRAD|nr:methyl-accepting chemotaxis protein [Undibacter mobilis]RDV05366.1 HAMP domain-containing protein [Undibacter mobilis]